MQVLDLAVPISHVEKLYGNETIVEVIEEKSQKFPRKVLEEKDLRPAANPEIKLVDEMEDSLISKMILHFL